MRLPLRRRRPALRLRAWGRQQSTTAASCYHPPVAGYACMPSCGGACCPTSCRRRSARSATLSRRPGGAGCGQASPCAQGSTQAGRGGGRRGSGGRAAASCPAAAAVVAPAPAVQHASHTQPLCAGNILTLSFGALAVNDIFAGVIVVLFYEVRPDCSRPSGPQYLVAKAAGALLAVLHVLRSFDSRLLVTCPQVPACHVPSGRDAPVLLVAQAQPARLVCQLLQDRAHRLAAG